MKVLHVCKSGKTGGAAIAAHRLVEVLREGGVDAKLLVQEDGREEDGIVSTTHSAAKKQLNFLRFAMERLLFLRHEKSKGIRFLFSPANTGEHLTRNTHVREADIIHLHWINAGFLSLKSLKALLKLGKPVVWTFHDMWPFTGGCHYAIDCKGYTAECGHCPYLKKPGKKDLSHRLWRKKKLLFGDPGVRVITPSNWLGDCVRESSMLAHWQQTTIHNPIDHALFKPAGSEDACRRLALDPSKQYILFGAANVKNMLKGYGYFLDAIRIIAQNQALAANTEILLFGKSGQEVARSLPLPATQFAFVESRQTMVDIYSAARLFVIPSLQDNLPNTVLESMLCGTPVVGFRTGGIPEMIIHQVNGFLADYKSAPELADGISWVLTNNDYERLSANTRASTLERYAKERSVEKHQDLYGEIMQKVSG